MNEFIDAVRERHAHRGLQAALPQLRRPPRRRHPVHRGQGADPGGVLPHVQLPLRGRRQIVISSDRPPREIADAGGTASLAASSGACSPTSRPPDLETRIAILRKRVETEGIAITDPEVLTFIASRVSANIRELEGALTRRRVLVAHRPPAHGELAENVLKDVYPQGEAAPEVTIARIQETCLAALRRDTPRRARQPEALPGGRISTAGRDVPLTRAHRRVAADDR